MSTEPRRRRRFDYADVILRHPIASVIVILAALAIMLDGTANLPRDQSLGPWTGYATAAFFLYAIGLAWLAPRFMHRPAAEALQVSIACAILPILLGWAGWNWGASKDFLWAGAVESTLLVVFVIGRGVQSRGSTTTTTEP